MPGLGYRPKRVYTLDTIACQRCRTKARRCDSTDRAVFQSHGLRRRRLPA
jgi:hypothetical protein